MTDTTNGPKLRAFTLDEDIRVGDQVAHAAGTEIRVRKPQAGELRGVDISALVSRCDFDQIALLGPRVTQPVLHKTDIAAMDPADLVQLGGEMVDFLLPKAARAAVSPDA